MKHTSNTKEEILDKALALFARDGYENVTVKDIADQVGIRSASVYNHYRNKQDIFEHIMDDFQDKRSAGQIDHARLHELIARGTVEEIVDAMTSSSYFMVEDFAAVKRLIYTTKVVYSRIYEDARAARCYREMYESGKLYLKAAIDYGIQIGRFREIDSEGYANAMASSYSNMGFLAFSSPNYEPALLEQEEKIKGWFRNIIASIIK